MLSIQEPIFILIWSPSISEKMTFEKQDSVDKYSIVKITKIPLSLDIELFVAENATTVSPLLAILNPESDASPPKALIIFKPDKVNWNPPISIGELYKISKWVSVKLPNDINPSKHHVPSPLHIPHSSYSPKQSSISSHIPSLSLSELLPKHIPLQSKFSFKPKQMSQLSKSLLNSWFVFPFEHISQSSIIASPKQSPLQSLSKFSPLHTPHSS